MIAVLPALALKVDVDTYRGTREGVPRLLRLFECMDVPATFLFSLGPDHTGRALRRIFRRGFLTKVRRTAVTSHYGWRTLLYGTLLPGPRIARRCSTTMRSVAAGGFSVGVHAFDHVAWQDRVAGASEEWTRRQLRVACEEFSMVFGRPPYEHGAAGWQINDCVPMLQHELGFRLASDTRGTEPFLPVVGLATASVPQLPTTLPTLDELIGRDDLAGRDPVEVLLDLSRTQRHRAQVYTLHAELEGGAYLESMALLISGWRAQGYRLVSLASLADGRNADELPRCRIVRGRVAGRAGWLAVQGPEVEAGALRAPLATPSESP